MPSLRDSFKSFGQNAIPGGRGEVKSFSTGFGSSISKRGLTIDPSIRALEDEALGRSNQLFGRVGEGLNDFLAKSRGLRQRFEGNRGALTQARVNPVLQANAQRLGSLEQNLGSRLLGGSSFANQALGNEASRASREEGDARALAEFETLGALTGIDQNDIQAIFAGVQQQSEFNNDSFEVARIRLQTELQSLGIGQNQQALLLQAYENQQRRSQQERKQIMDTTLDFMGAFGGGAGGGGGGGTS